MREPSAAPVFRYVPMPPPPQSQPPLSALRPRADAADAFESNPAAAVQGRIEGALLEGMSDAERVKGAMQDVVSGSRLDHAARAWQVAPSSLAAWREKYMKLLEQGTGGEKPAFETIRDTTHADLVTIPAMAREQFQQNWERLLDYTHSHPESFHQSPWDLFLENSWLTGWMFEEGKFDRGVFYGTASAVAALLLTGSFLFAGKSDDTPILDSRIISDPHGFNETVSAAEGVAQRFFKAENLQEKMAFMRLNDSIRPLVEEYFKLHPPRAIRNAEMTQSTATRGVVSLEFEVPDEERRHMLNVVDRGGMLLIDWESSSFCQEMQFRNLVQVKPTSPVRLNAKIQESDYWSYGFTEDKYVCFLLTYPGLHLDVYGYAEKDSAIATRLQSRLSIRANEPAVVSVRYPEPIGGANQVLITDLIHDEWLREQ